MKHLAKLTLISILIILLSCEKEDVLNDTNLEDSNSNDSSQITKPFYEISNEELGNAVVEGYVTDQNGLALEGAIVQFGQLKTKSNAQGYYYLNAVSEGEKKSIHFSKEGYFMNQRLASIKNGRNARIDASLYQVEMEETINEAGAKLRYSDFQIEIPEGAFKKEVVLKATAHRVTDNNFLNSFPGEFSGVRENGEFTLVQSFGFLNIEISDSENLIDPLKAVTIKIEAPENAPRTIPMWYYDYKKQTWVEEGEGWLDGEWYVAKVNHFTPWNWDVPVENSRIEGRVVDQNGTQLEDAKVTIRNKTNGNMLSIYSDSDGKFSSLTQAGTDVEITASWNFYEPTEIVRSTSPSRGGTLNVGDIVINLGQNFELAPIILNNPVELLSGEIGILKGKYFGNEYKVNYHILIDGRSLTTIKTEDNLQSDNEVGNILNWSNEEIQFTVPSWVRDEGTVQVVRAGSESNLASYERPRIIRIDNWNTSNSEILNNNVAMITSSSDGFLWFGYWNYNHGGLTRFDGTNFETWTNQNDPDLPYGTITDIVESNEGNLWLGTDFGLIKFETNNFTSFSESNSDLPNNRIKSIIEDFNGNLWIANWFNQGGLTKFNKKEEFEYWDSDNSGLLTRHIEQIIQSENSNIWIASQDGLIVFNGTSFQMINNNNSEAVFQDRNRNIWYGGQGFIGKLENVNQNYDLKYFNISGNVTEIKEDNYGNLWISTNNGLFEFNEIILNHYLAGTHIYDIEIDFEGNIWAGSYQNGLFKISIEK